LLENLGRRSTARGPIRRMAGKAENGDEIVGSDFKQPQAGP
jgi:hypothetical protein